MSRHQDGRGDPVGGFPRVSGDEPAEALLVREQVGFSPRERG